jgi:hypothetical protein
VDRMPNHPSGPLQNFNTTSTLPVGYQATLWLHFEIRFDCPRQPCGAPGAEIQNMLPLQINQGAVKGF